MDSSVDSLAKTKDAVKLLAALGAQADTDKCADSKKLRAGKGKMRNRRYTMRRGPLIVHDAESKGGAIVLDDNCARRRLCRRC